MYVYANVAMSKTSAVTKPVTVQIQNRSPHPEIVPDAAALARLATLNVQSLGACPAPQAVLRPKLLGRLPLTLKSKQKLSVPFDVTFDCANDAGNSTPRTPGHDDFRVSASLDHSALGSADAHPDDDGCPRSVAPPGVIDPYPDGKILDKGCGTREPDGTLGGAIVIDVTRNP